MDKGTDLSLVECWPVPQLSPHKTNTFIYQETHSFQYIKDKGEGNYRGLMEKSVDIQKLACDLDHLQETQAPLAADMQTHIFRLKKVYNHNSNPETETY